jgi:hypothetical protein
MKKRAIFGLFTAAALPLLAQTPQIPTMQVCNLSGATSVLSAGSPLVHIPSRAPGGFTGNVNIRVAAGCDPTTGFPVGSVSLFNVSMNDPSPAGFVGSISSVQIDQLTFTGTVNPTAYMAGKCIAQSASTAGAVGTIPCHFWVLFAHTSGPNDTAPSLGPDIVSFLVVDKSGKRLAYATGPVVAGSGGVFVAPTTN